ncbi:MAG TPA: DUF4157 domain-containing protein [Kofleriaceae bacterium]|nr:DUF4157 domain-containing protein [Kofleriaceae bacterium]
MTNAIQQKTTTAGAQSSASITGASSVGPGKRTLTESMSVQRKAKGSPALHADTSAVADSFAGGDVAGQVGGSLPHGPHQTAADVADGGFAGGGHEIPHRAAMEKSFGMDFGHVKAHTDSGAVKANHTLGSHAYAMGSQVAFKSASPSPSLVAHELTHVVQQTHGPQYKTDGGVDTSGEAEADAVEAAVSAGKPASSALKSGPSGGSGPGLKSIGSMAAGPARKRGPALEAEGGGSRFGMGMTFSLEGFEKTYDYTIWKGHYAWPIGVPGINFVVDPNVKVSGRGQAGYGGEKKGDLSAQLGVFGECGIGLSGGIPDVAEVYGTFNPAIEGAFTLTKVGNHGGGEHEGGEHPAAAEAAHGPASTWSLVGAITLKAAAKVGVSLGGGIVDQAFELGSIEIAKLTGVYFDQTGFRRDKMGFEWSEPIRRTFDNIKRALDTARNMGRAAINAMGDAASTAGHAVRNAAGNFGTWVTSW